MNGTVRTFLGLVFLALLSCSVGRPAWAEPVRLKEGADAPAFTLRSKGGAVYRLSDFAYKARQRGIRPKDVVLVDFFRRDCEPCIAALPELAELDKRYGASGLRVMLIALLEPEDGKAKLDRFLADRKDSFLVLFDQNEVAAKAYMGDPVKLPATFLVDRNGRLTKVRYGGGGSLLEAFEPAIKKALAAPIPKLKRNRSTVPTRRSNLSDPR